jgi:hypothetical protein
MKEREMSGEMAEEKLSSMAVEFGLAVEWQVSATRDRNNMGDQIDLPIDF